MPINPENIIISTWCVLHIHQVQWDNSKWAYEKCSPKISGTPALPPACARRVSPCSWQTRASGSSWSLGKFWKANKHWHSDCSVHGHNCIDVCNSLAVGCRASMQRHSSEVPQLHLCCQSTYQTQSKGCNQASLIPCAELPTYITEIRFSNRPDKLQKISLNGAASWVFLFRIRKQNKWTKHTQGPGEHLVHRAAGF